MTARNVASLGLALFAIACGGGSGGGATVEVVPGRRTASTGVRDEALPDIDDRSDAESDALSLSRLSYGTARSASARAACRVVLTPTVPGTDRGMRVPGTN